MVILAVSLILLPESPRFLMQHKKIQQLNIELNRIARVNKTKEAAILTESAILMMSSKNSLHNANNSSHPRAGIEIVKSVFSSKNQVINTLLLGFIWFSISMTYYGVSLGTEKIESKYSYQNTKPIRFQNKV